MTYVARALWSSDSSRRRYGLVVELPSTTGDDNDTYKSMTSPTPKGYNDEIFGLDTDITYGRLLSTVLNMVKNDNFISGEA